MPHIDVTRSHDLGLDGARRAAEEVAADLDDQMAVETRWEGDTLVASGRGFDGRIEAGASTVRVTATLGLLLRPLRGNVRSEIEAYLDRYVA